MSDFPKPASSRTPKMSQTLKGTSQLRKSDGGLRKSTGNMSATVNGYVIYHSFGNLSGILFMIKN